MIIPCRDAGGYRQFKFKLGNKYHCGRDRNVKSGEPIYSVKNGKVIFSGDISGFGSYGAMGGVVMIESDDNHHTILYGHIKPFVLKNDIIRKGDLIGRVIKYEYRNGDKIIRADHLHWGDWIHGGIPTTKMGYVIYEDLKNWDDPNKNLGA